MSGIAIAAQIDQASMSRFMAHMEKRATFLRRGQKSIVEIGAVKLITALKAATVVAKKRREIVENPEWFAARNEAVQAGRSNSAATRYAKGKKVPRYAVRFDFKRVKNGIPLAVGGSLLPLNGAENMAWARENPLTQIRDLNAGGFRGIARQSWNWTLKALGKSSGIERAGAAESSYVATKNGNGYDVTWTGINRVYFARKAMTRSVSSSVHAAATMLRKENERLAADASGEIGFK